MRSRRFVQWNIADLHTALDVSLSPSRQQPAHQDYDHHETQGPNNHHLLYQGIRKRSTLSTPVRIVINVRISPEQ